MRVKVQLTILLLALMGHSYACKCNDPGTVMSSFAGSDFVVSGHVLSKEPVSYSQTVKADSVPAIRERLKNDKQKLQYFEISYIFKVELQVVERYKGTNLRDTVTIYTPMNSASCGYKFEVGKSYIIYASKESYLAFMFMDERDRRKGLEKENTYWTSHCTRTTEYNRGEAKTLRLLRKN